MRIKKILHIILFITGLLLLASIVLACLSIYISPAGFWIPAFFGLAYPFLLLTNLLFAIYWAIRKRKKLLIVTAAVIIAGTGFITDIFQIGFLNGKDAGDKIPVKIMTYNTKLFNLYEWNNNSQSRNNMFRIIDSVDADILCFQEFYKEKTNRFNTLDTLLEFQKAIYYHEEYTYINRQTYFFGIITFSRWPIINKGVFHFPGSDNICIFSDMVIHGDTLRIYNCHLESIRFDHKDYAFLDSIELKLDEKRIEGARSIFKRLKYAYIKRAAQADTLAGHIRNCPFPVILCGDFNDTPISYSYHMISRDLEDSFKEAGSGLGVTYAGKFPSFRIDYVLHSKEFEAISMDIISKNYSDHYPVTVELIKRDQ